jgi:hypothetical protein
VNTQAQTLFYGIETYVKHFSSKINSHIIKNKVRLACKHDLVKTAVSDASDMQIQSLIYNKETVTPHVRKTTRLMLI